MTSGHPPLDGPSTATAPPAKESPPLRTRKRIGLITAITCLLVGTVGVGVAAEATSARLPASGASVPVSDPSSAVFPVRPPAAARTGVAAGPAQLLMAGPIDWGDPVIVGSDGTFHLYSTQPLPWVHVPVESARGGGTWSVTEDALPTLPAWAESGKVWAPDVHRFGDRWVLYFSAQIQGSDPAVHCIGDTTAASPTGPFRPAAAPFLCQPWLGGSIDPRVYVSPSGTPYLVWKSDNNSNRAKYGPTAIWSERLRGDGLALIGEPTSIFAPDRPWEGMLLEAPDLVTVDGRTWLFFSGGEGFWSPDYSIGLASCAGPLGPCASVGTTPLVSGNAQGQGPGEESVFDDDGRYWLVYDLSDSAGGATPRAAGIAPLSFRGAVPAIASTGTG